MSSKETPQEGPGRGSECTSGSRKGRRVPAGSVRGCGPRPRVGRDLVFFSPRTQPPSSHTHSLMLASRVASAPHTDCTWGSSGPGDPGPQPHGKEQGDAQSRGPGSRQGGHTPGASRLRATSPMGESPWPHRKGHHVSLDMHPKSAPPSLQNAIPWLSILEGLLSSFFRHFWERMPN